MSNQGLTLHGIYNVSCNDHIPVLKSMYYACLRIPREEQTSSFLYINESAHRTADGL